MIDSDDMLFFFETIYRRNSQPPQIMDMGCVAILIMLEF